MVQEYYPDIDINVWNKTKFGKSQMLLGKYLERIFPNKGDCIYYII